MPNANSKTNPFFLHISDLKYTKEHALAKTPSECVISRAALVGGGGFFKKTNLRSKAQHVLESAFSM
jgi:hypothetical protein